MSILSSGPIMVKSIQWVGRSRPRIKSRTDAPGGNIILIWGIESQSLVLRGIGWFLLAAGVVLLADLLFLLTEG